MNQYNKSILILSLILLLLQIPYTQQKTCQIHDNQYYNLQKQFSNQLNSQGQMDLEQYGYDFNADTPMPEDNVVLRFKIMVQDSKDKYFFSPLFPTESNLELSIIKKNKFTVSGVNEHIIYFPGQSPQRIYLSGNFDVKKIRRDFMLFTIYISKTEVRLYIDETLAATQKLTQYYDAQIDYYSNDNQYTISPLPQWYGGPPPVQERNTNTYMNDLAIFRDLQEDQVKCLSENTDVELDMLSAKCKEDEVIVDGNLCQKVAPNSASCQITNYHNVLLENSNLRKHLNNGVLDLNQGPYTYKSNLSKAEDKLVVRFLVKYNQIGDQYDYNQIFTPYAYDSRYAGFSFAFTEYNTLTGAGFGNEGYSKLEGTTYKNSRNEWASIMYVYSDGDSSLYINGQKVQTGITNNRHDLQDGFAGQNYVFQNSVEDSQMYLKDLQVFIDPSYNDIDCLASGIEINLPQKHRGRNVLQMPRQIENFLQNFDI